MTFSYFPAKCQDGSYNQMRFELGDTEVNTCMDHNIQELGQTAILCDEEYIKVIEKHSKSWTKAKLACIKAILFKLAYQVDYSDAEMSIHLSQRAEFYKKLYDQIKSSLVSAPEIGLLDDLVNNQLDRGHYFHKDMHRPPTTVYRRGLEHLD